MSIKMVMIVYSKHAKRLINFFQQKQKLPELELFNAIDSISNYEIYKKFALDNNLIKIELINYLEGIILNSKPLYGILGCYLSHFFTLNDFLTNTNSEWLLVLEDDVVLKDFSKELLETIINEATNINSDFVQLYTSPQFLSKQLEEPLLTFHLRRMIKQWGAVAYLINKKAVRTIISKIPFSDALDIVFSNYISYFNSTCYVNSNIVNMGSYDCKAADNELGSLIMNNP